MVADVDVGLLFPFPDMRDNPHKRVHEHSRVCPTYGEPFPMMLNYLLLIVPILDYYSNRYQ